MNRPSLVRYAWLSIAAAVATIVLKFAAYALTDSIGLLSDAVESSANLLGAVMALLMLSVAARPPDAGHLYGHSKAEFFASGLEGILILIAAAAIAVSAVERLVLPHPLERPGLGLAICALASAINFVVARTLLRVGRERSSISLEADARHLLTDVWTSIGVIGGVGAVALTGWTVLDPLLALLVAVNIVRTGVSLVRRSVGGLMDSALPAEESAKVLEVLEAHRRRGIQFHALRSRQAAARRFVSVHVLVPGHWTVQQGHETLERIEADIRAVLPEVTVFTHLEPIEDPASFADTGLDRRESTPPGSPQPPAGKPAR